MRRLTAKRVLEAFCNLTLTVVEYVIRHLTLQQRRLALAGLEDSCYLQLVEHSTDPAQAIG